LTSLFLANNQLRTPLAAGLFEPIEKTIEVIDVSFNNMTVLDAGSFGEMQKLNSLKLRANQLNTIDENAFTGMPEITFLDLGVNRLSGKDLAFLCSLGDSLQELRLDQNRIRQYDYSDFLCLGKLVEIDLCWNPAFLLFNPALKRLADKRVEVGRNLTVNNKSGPKANADEGFINADRSKKVTVGPVRLEFGGKLHKDQQTQQKLQLQQQDKLNQAINDQICLNLAGLKEIWGNPDNNEIEE
jgi:Leucine-rich repeat (LRR) protein